MTWWARRDLLPRGESVFLRRPTRRDADAFIGLMRASAGLHHPWVDPPRTRSSYTAYLRRLRSAGHEGFLVCLRQSGEIAGVVNLNNIVRGSLQSATLGYFVIEAHAGKGRMREGLALVVRHAFETLGLHRLEADIQPANRRSIVLVRGLGFSLEGLSPRYLRVAEQWRDHERWALLGDDWRARQPAR